jgi:hypothetical protein
MTNAQTIDSLRTIAALARLRHKAERSAALPAVQAALRRCAATFEEVPAEFAARVLLEIDTALPQVGPEPDDSGPARDTSRVLARAAADLCLLVGN